MNRLSILLVLIATGFHAKAQDSATLNGRLVDASNGDGLVGANVQLITVRDTTVVFLTSTDRDGYYHFKDLTPTFYKIRYSSIGYETGEKLVRVKAPATNLGAFSVAESSELLEEIQVVGKNISVETKGDTTSIKASGYKVNVDASAEDLLAKMPGIIVNGSGVQAQGEQVEKVLVDGREFFANDPNIALKNIPAEIVEKIEVFDQQSEQAQFSGFDDGNTTKTLNIVTKLENRNGQFGRVYAGGNLDQQYNIGGNINHFKNDLRISVVGMSNNINKQNFSSEDLLGVASASSRRGGRPGFGGPGSGMGRSESFITNQNQGIAETHAYGINYSNAWGEKIRVTGSYFFNLKDNENNQIVNRENFVPESSNQFYNEISNSYQINYNNRFNMRLIYSINDRNSLIFTPNINWQKTDTDDLLYGTTTLAEGGTLNTIVNDFNSNNSGYNVSGNLLYRYRFLKRGRTLAIRTGIQSSDAEGKNDLDNLLAYNDTGLMNDTILQHTDIISNGTTYNVNINYTEPISQSMQFQLGYKADLNDDDSDNKTYNIATAEAPLDTILSNVFNSRYITQSPTIGLFLRKEKMFFRLALSYQWATLNSEQQFPQTGSIDRKFKSILPGAMMRYKFSDDANLRVFYRTYTQKPSISQLQNVVDNSNPLYISIGNPTLDQSTNHMVMARFSKINAKKASSFFTLVSLRAVDDYVTNSTLIVDSDSLINGEYLLRRGGQISSPVNLSGYLNTRLMMVYGIPLSFIKSNLNLNAGATYTKTPGLVNNVTNVSKSIAYNSSVVLSSNISENIDFTLLYDITYNDVRNDVTTNLNNDYNFQSAGMKINWNFLDGFVFRNQISYQKYMGYTDGFNEEFTLWNMSLARKFLKNKQAEIELMVYDLLKQNTSISRINTESYIEETQTSVLQQYFMLLFTYKISNFKGVVERKNDMDQFRRRW
ncbi:MAG: outer membrane beta-barrel protein [Bacteroidota bacterium]